MEVIFAGGLFASLLFIVLFCAALLAWFQGLLLTFRAHILLGIICFCLGVPFILIGVIYWLSGIDLPAALMRALRS